MILWKSFLFCGKTDIDIWQHSLLDKKIETTHSCIKMLQPFKKILFCLFVSLFFSAAEAVNLSWSGSGRMEAFYQDEKNYYSSLYFALNSEIHIIDSVSFHARFDIVGFEPKENAFWKNILSQKRASLLSQSGFIFLYEEDSDQNKTMPVPFILPALFYLDYEREFFKVRLGRAPYHFGLGTTYSAENSPFNLWMNAPDQISIYMEYQNFYLQPSFFHQIKDSSERELSALLQGGIEQQDWRLSLLYEYKLKKDEDSFIEIYGEYQQKNWKAKLSSSYIFTESTNLSLAFEGGYFWPAVFPVDLELKAGGLIGSARFNPQYNLSLILQNRWMKKIESPRNTEAFKKYQIAGAQIQESVYVSPRLTFSFFEESLKLQPLFLLTGSLDGKKWTYEWDLFAKYKIYESFFLQLQGGALYEKKWVFALLAQAAVSF